MAVQTIIKGVWGYEGWGCVDSRNAFDLPGSRQSPTNGGGQGWYGRLAQWLARLVYTE